MLPAEPLQAQGDRLRTDVPSKYGIRREAQTGNAGASCFRRGENFRGFAVTVRGRAANPSHVGPPILRRTSGWPGSHEI